LAADAWETAWKDEPARRLKGAKQLSARASLDVRRIGMRMELKALRQQGAFAEARARVEAELKKTPDDRQLQAMLGEVAADLGDFATARKLALAQADATEGAVSAAHLNNAAWYSIFGKPDDAARQQAERAVQVQASAAHLNTLAAVYVTMGEWDEAARAFRRQQHAEGFEDDAQPDPSYWYVRGRLAEAFGRKPLAVAAYKKMTRARNKSADDTFLLAETRLKALELH
jgi:tetratricopeptide (TPR) repeat protein